MLRLNSSTKCRGEFGHTSVSKVSKIHFKSSGFCTNSFGRGCTDEEERSTNMQDEPHDALLTKLE